MTVENFQEGAKQGKKKKAEKGERERENHSAGLRVVERVFSRGEAEVVRQQAQRAMK